MSRVRFTPNDNTPGSSYLWHFDDPWSFQDNLSSTRVPIHTFQYGGTYSVSLTVYSGGVDVTDTTDVTVSGGDPPSDPYILRWDRDYDDYYSYENDHQNIHVESQDNTDRSMYSPRSHPTYYYTYSNGFTITMSVGGFGIIDDGYFRAGVILGLDKQLFWNVDNGGSTWSAGSNDGTGETLHASGHNFFQWLRIHYNSTTAEFTFEGSLDDSDTDVNDLDFSTYSYTIPAFSGLDGSLTLFATANYGNVNIFFAEVDDLTWNRNPALFRNTYAGTELTVGSQSVTIASSDTLWPDQDAYGKLFYFDLTQQTALALVASGNPDLDAVFMLFEGEGYAVGEEIYTGDDTEDSYLPEIYAVLPAGRYWLLALGYDSSQLGTFNLDYTQF